MTATKALIEQVTKGFNIRLAITLGMEINGVFCLGTEKYQIRFCVDYIMEDGEEKVSLDSIRMEHDKPSELPPLNEQNADGKATLELLNQSCWRGPHHGVDWHE